MSQTNKSKYPPADQLALLREEIGARARSQADELEGLDRKGTTTLAANGVVLGLVLNNVEDFHGVTGWSPVFFNVALGVLAVGLVLGVAQLWPRGFRVVPKPRQFLDRYYGKNSSYTTAKLLSTNLLAFERNEGLSKQKGWLLKGQMITLAGGGTLLVLAYLVKELLP
jgi:hypothetical protein